jgi:hypothetical protein
MGDESVLDQSTLLNDEFNKAEDDSLNTTNISLNIGSSDVGTERGSEKIFGLGENEISMISSGEEQTFTIDPVTGEKIFKKSPTRKIRWSKAQNTQDEVEKAVEKSKRASILAHIEYETQKEIEEQRQIED